MRSEIYYEGTGISERSGDNVPKKPREYHALDITCSNNLTNIYILYLVYTRQPDNVTATRKCNGPCALNNGSSESTLWRRWSSGPQKEQANECSEVNCRHKEAT